MKVEDWMTRDLCVCRPETSLSDAAHFMWITDCGCLPVVDKDERIVGMLTDRDVCMAAYTQGRALSELRASDCMSREVWSCRPSEPVEHVIRLMGARQVRRVPVVDDSGRLVGLISISDIARRLANATDQVVRASLRARVILALARISEKNCHLHDPSRGAPARNGHEPITKGDGE